MKLLSLLDRVMKDERMWVCGRERESEEIDPERERVVGVCLERCCGFCRDSRGVR